jgi:hypothetical protein
MGGKRFMSGSRRIWTPPRQREKPFSGSSRMPILANNMRDAVLVSRATAMTRGSPARSWAKRSAATAASRARPWPRASGQKAKRSAMPRPSARRRIPAMPRKASVSMSRADQMPMPWAPQARMSSASSSVAWRWVRMPPSIIAKAWGSAFSAAMAEASTPATGRMTMRPVRKTQAGFHQSSERIMRRMWARRAPRLPGADAEQAGGGAPGRYRASGRYLIRCGSVAWAPSRRRLSSS